MREKLQRESIVLLKNENGILPIHAESTHSIAVIGRFAKTRIQGAGAKVTPTRVDIPFEEMKQLAGASVELSYAEGYPEDDSVNEK